MSNKVLRREAVQERTGLSRSLLYELMSRGEFPPPIQLGPRAVGWYESDIEAWFKSRRRGTRG